MILHAETPKHVAANGFASHCFLAAEELAMTDMPDALGD